MDTRQQRQRRVRTPRGSRGAMEESMEHALEAEFGFEITTFVRTRDRASQGGPALSRSRWPPATPTSSRSSRPPRRDERCESARGGVERLRHARRAGSRRPLADARPVHRTRLTAKTWDLVGGIGAPAATSTSSEAGRQAAVIGSQPLARSSPARAWSPRTGGLPSRPRA